MSHSQSMCAAVAELPYATPLAEIFDVVFAELPRRDQRERAVQYIQGLLETRGRKSIRNIAAQLGDSAAEQRLHHFVSSSPWEWKGVRDGLAEYIERHLEPEAWVVRPMIIPKSGTSSVGVERRYFPSARQVLNAQYAIGVWSASGEVSCPVNWRLQLSERWLTNSVRRAAGIPAGAVAESVEECVVAACHDVPATGSSKPFVVDVPEMDAAAAAGMFVRSRLPMLVRIGGGLRLGVDGALLAGYESDTYPALQIMGACRERVRPVPVRQLGARTAVDLSAAVRVRVPGRRGVGGTGSERMVLLGHGRAGGTWPSELWLTNLVDVAPAALLRLTGLRRRVDHDFAEITEGVGIRDFAGRSFGGWNRHVTLTSAAHVVTVQTITSELRYGRGPLGRAA